LNNGQLSILLIKTIKKLFWGDFEFLPLSKIIENYTRNYRYRKKICYPTIITNRNGYHLFGTRGHTLKDHFKTNLRSEQDHRLKIDLKSDQDHVFF
jgi:hypothetical protein